MVNLRPARIPCLDPIDCPVVEEIHRCVLEQGHDGYHWDHGYHCIPFGMEWD
jgi:hypothetical protein